jgi:ATP-dependent Clp protease adaptor protein ClpS
MSAPPPAAKSSPALPEVAPEQKQRERTRLLPPWNVLLWNDDHNEMLYVVRSIQKAVPAVSRAQAVAIMLEAHNSGKALVTTCPLEHAELYRDRLLSFGLTATIEPA